MATYNNAKLLEVIPPPIREMWLDLLRRSKSEEDIKILIEEGVNDDIYDFISMADFFVAKEGYWYWDAIRTRLTRIWYNNIAKGNIK